MRLSFLFAITFFFLSGFAQDLLIQGRVTEQGTERPIKDAYVSLGESEQVAVSESNGEFVLLLDNIEQLGFSLFVQHIGYESKSYEFSYQAIQNAKNTKGVMQIRLEMNPHTYPLDTAIISSDPLPEIVYASEQHSLADYEFMEEGLLILAYEKRLEKASKLYLLNAEMLPVDSLLIHEKIKATGLRKDYAKEIYLESSGAIHWIFVNEKGRLELQELDKQIFQESIAPIIDTLEKTVYFSTWIDQFPAFDYMDLDLRDTSYARIRQIADDFMLELCRAEYKYLNTRDKLRLYRLELETGVEKEVLACIATFKDGLYYDPIYAPMFRWKDSLFIFDHTSDMLFIYDAESQPLDSVAISYHQPEKVMGNAFSKQLYMDESSGNVYALFQKPGGRCWLELIDKQTGKSKEAITLRYPYPTDIQVKENEIYYLYRPFSSIQKKYLYREFLRQ